MNRNAEKLNSFSSGLIGLAVRVLVAAGLLLVLARGMAVAYRFGYSAFYEQGKDAPPGKNIYVDVYKRQFRRWRCRSVSLRHLRKQRSCLLYTSMAI